MHQPQTSKWLAGHGHDGPSCRPRKPRALFPPTGDRGLPPQHFWQSQTESPQREAKSARRARTNKSQSAEALKKKHHFFPPVKCDLGKKLIIVFFFTAHPSKNSIFSRNANAVGYQLKCSARFITTVDVFDKLRECVSCVFNIINKSAFWKGGEASRQRGKHAKPNKTAYRLTAARWH